MSDKPKGITVRETVLGETTYYNRTYTDEEILEIFPDEDLTCSFVNPLLRRAQKAEAELQNMSGRVGHLEADRAEQRAEIERLRGILESGDKIPKELTVDWAIARVRCKAAEGDLRMLVVGLKNAGLVLATEVERLQLKAAKWALSQIDWRSRGE